MEVKDILKSRRKDLGLTLLQVATACGVSEGTVSRWESGEIENMRRDKIQALATVLKIDPAIIMGWRPLADLTVLSDEEERIVMAYRGAPEGRKEAVRALLGL